MSADPAMSFCLSTSSGPSALGSGTSQRAAGLPAEKRNPTAKASDNFHLGGYKSWTTSRIGIPFLASCA